MSFEVDLARYQREEEIAEDIEEEAKEFADECMATPHELTSALADLCDPAIDAIAVKLPMQPGEFDHINATYEQLIAAMFSGLPEDGANAMLELRDRLYAHFCERGRELAEERAASWEPEE